MEFNLATDQGTGTLCRCGHGSDRHELAEVVFLDGVTECPKLGWNFTCDGVFNATALGPSAGCTCTNFQGVAWS